MARPAKKKSGEVVVVSRAAQLTRAAQEYHDNHHWVPLRLTGKAACGDGWQKRTLQDAIPRFQGGDNIGILLGEPSGNLVRLDADFPAIPDVTSILFPEPTLTFGRPSSPLSGRLITCDVKSTDFKLPEAMRNHPRLPLHDGKPGLMVYQVLSTGKQTMVPPSIHVRSGEELAWQSPPGVGPAPIDAPELLRREGIEAFLMVVRQFWPARGTRNEAAMALARVLLEALAAHYADHGERCAVVDQLVVAVAMAGGDGEGSRKGKARATTTLEKMRAGQETTGMTRLLELLELPVSVATTFWKWLGTTQVVVRDMRFPDVAKDGAPRPTLENTKVALDLLSITCAHDLFSLRYVVGGQSIQLYAGEVQDPVVHELRSLIRQNFGFEVGKHTVLDAICTLANRHRHHPVRDYLDGLTWDGTPRIDRWLIDYCGAEDDEFNRTVGALVLTAAVRRVRQPGVKFDEMLVLESTEGRDKSSMLQALAGEPQWFTDSLDLRQKGRETIEQTSGKWICEIAELQGMKKAELEQVKSWLSRTHDRGRLAYGLTVTEAGRQFIIIGTTNSDIYLRSQEGNRRFWPVRVERCDLIAIRRDRDQLWAEAAQREAAGARIRLPEALWSVAAEKQLERTTENPLTEPLENLLTERGRDYGKPMEGKVTTSALWRGLGVPLERQEQLYTALGNAMRELGWNRQLVRIEGSRPLRGYVKGEPPYKAIECSEPKREEGERIGSACYLIGPGMRP